MLLDFLFSKGAFGMLLKCQLQAMKFHRRVFNKCPIFDRGFHKSSSQRVPIRRV